MKFIQREDGEGFEVKPNTIHMITCCDCGLVHKMAVAIEENGKVGVAFEQDEEETKKRRGRAVGGEIVSPYEELLLYVGSKYPNETRHETALRYIKEAESRGTTCSQTKMENK